MKETQSRVTNSIRNMVTGVLFQILTLIIQFVYRIFFVRILGSLYLGTSGLFTNILSIFSFAELGIGQAIVFSLYKPIAENDREKICALMGLYKKAYHCVGFAVLALGLAFFPIYPLLLNGGAENIPQLNTIYLLYVFSTGVGYFFSYKTSFLTACQKNYVLNTVCSVMTIVSYVAQTVILYLTKNFIAVLVIQIVMNILQNVVASGTTTKLYPYLNDPAPRLEKKDKDGIIKNIRALLVYKIGTLALNSTDNIIISLFVGTAWVGYYSNYLAIVSAIVSFASILFSSLTASIGNLNAIGEKQQKKFIFSVCNFASFAVYTFIGACFFVALDPFAEICYGSEYVLGKTISAIIVMNTYIAGMLFAPFNYRQTMGLFVFGKWRPVISAVINIIVSVCLASYMGLAGVILGTIIARVTTNVWFDPYIVYNKGFGESPKSYYLDYLIKIVLFAAICLLCGGLCGLIPVPGIFGLLLKCCAAGVISILAVVCLYGRTEEFRYLTGILKSRLLPGKTETAAE